MDGGAIHGNGSITTVLLPSPFLITVRRMITFQVSFPSELFSFILHPGLSLIVIESFGPPFDIHPTGEHSNWPPCWMRAPGAVVPAFTVS